MVILMYMIMKHSWHHMLNPGPELVSRISAPIWQPSSSELAMYIDVVDAQVSAVVWPRTGYITLMLQATTHGQAFEGYVAGIVSFRVSSHMYEDIVVDLPALGLGSCMD